MRIRRAWIRNFLWIAVTALATWVARYGFTPPNSAVAGESAPPVAHHDLKVPQNLNDLDLRIWLVDALADADEPNLAAIAKALAANPDESIWRAVFHPWFRKNPVEAWKFALDLSDSRSDSELCLIALETWAAVDPTATRAALQTPGETQFKAMVRGAKAKDIEAAFRLLGEALASGVTLDDTTIQAPDNFNLDDEEFAELAGRNPMMAIQWAEQLNSGRFLGPVVAGWLAKDSTAARQWIDSRPDREEIVEHALMHMSDYTAMYLPESVAALIEMQPSGNFKSEALGQIMENLAIESPELAVKETMRLFPDAENRVDALCWIARCVMEQDFNKAWEILNLVDDSMLLSPRLKLPRAETGLASDDGISIPFQYFQSLTNGRFERNPLELKSTMLAQLIMVDKDQALRLMERIPVKEFQDMGQDALDRWSYRAPEEAAAWLARKFGSQGDVGEIRDWLLNWDLNDEIIRHLAERLPQGSVRAALEFEIADQLAENDPAGALDFARDHGGDAESIRNVYTRWAKKDPEAALQHLAASPNSPAEAWEDVVDESLATKPEDTTRIVDDLPAGAARDHAAASIARQLANGADPVRAAEWALSIHSEPQRREVLEHIVDRISTDLRLLHSPEAMSGLRDTIRGSTGIQESEKSRWLEQIDSFLAKP